MEPSSHCRPGHHILSLSPELFFRIENQGPTRRIATRPMKGTAPRGRTTREDRVLADWLRNDPKNRAENVMIVDLLRNDLGRLCAFGSVHVETLFALERYRTLWQMTSAVTGRTPPRGRLPSDLPRPLSLRIRDWRAQGPVPCNSSPSSRTSLEASTPVPSASFPASAPSSTSPSVPLQLEAAHGVMGIGSGVVIDSSADDEFRECQLKAVFLSRSVELLPHEFSLIETLLCDNGYPLLELHLDRLQDSAAYFDFPCVRANVKAALLAHAAAQPADCLPRKVRLLLDQAGNLEILSEPLPPVPAAGEARRARACIASRRIDPLDPMYFHKTTHRPIYTEAFQTAVQAGFDEVLFLNTRGEVTEGAISNIFIEKAGRWFTPPVDCGLLSGVFRRHISLRLAPMPKSASSTLKTCSKRTPSISPTPYAACARSPFAGIATPPSPDRATQNVCEIPAMIV